MFRTQEQGRRSRAGRDRARPGHRQPFEVARGLCAHLLMFVVSDAGNLIRVTRVLVERNGVELQLQRVHA